ncbi:hypothetical protein C8J55DRAFT_527203 [Lentinula edodes]|uniref:Pheromone n=1 Tax=Lentinula lateritia TaxID=40482 RepID=A0A9W9DFB6_9AGAR|nr:hypothetical protein C8J55DRAFT_527203 [Lentinula edodes]
MATKMTGFVAIVGQCMCWTVGYSRNEASDVENATSSSFDSEVCLSCIGVSDWFDQ